MLQFFRQRKVVKTRNGGLTNLDTESEVIPLRDDLKKALDLMKIALICLLFALMALLLK
jgi:hypothetical protein